MSATAGGRPKCQRLRKATDPFCTVVRLAGDETLGRDNGTPGSALARSFLIDQLKRVSQGLNRRPPATPPIPSPSRAAPTCCP